MTTDSKTDIKHVIDAYLKKNGILGPYEDSEGRWFAAAPVGIVHCLGAKYVIELPVKARRVYAAEFDDAARQQMISQLEPVFEEFVEKKAPFQKAVVDSTKQS